MPDLFSPVDQDQPFNPLDKVNLGRTVAEAMLSKPPVSLARKISANGAGIYALYYAGKNPYYAPIAEINRKGGTLWPIYVGKAIPKGGRKGGGGTLVPSKSNILGKRLDEHAESIAQTPTLALEDFSCRYLAVDDIWIPLGESLLISRFRPIWNVALDGFGNHDPGAGRYQQQRSPWDILHPGRSWALRCAEGKSKQVVEKILKEYFQSQNRK